MRSVYLVLAVMPWGTESENDMIDRAGMPDSSGQGFCTVFDSLEEAQRHWPDEDIMELKVQGAKLGSAFWATAAA